LRLIEKPVSSTFPASDAVAMIQPTPERGILSDLDMRGIAAELEKRKVPTPRGGSWREARCGTAWSWMSK
jgi:hypothetical protein